MQDPVDPNAQAPQDPQAGDQGATPPTPPTPPAGDQGATPPPADPAAAAQAAQPAAPAPAAPTPAAPAGGQPAAQGDSKLGGIMEENVDISGLIQNAGNAQQQQDFISRVKVPPHPNTTFDEAKFVQLLAGSISLTIGEKERIITAIPQLSQFQIDELIKIFEEEQVKFTELEKKHAEQVAELEKQHAGDWQDLESKKEEEEAASEEAQQAEDIKKNLGL